MVVLVICWLAAAELLVLSRPHGVLEWATAAMTGLGLGLLWYENGNGPAGETEGGPAPGRRGDDGPDGRPGPRPSSG
ncbi:hypothetical protein ABZY57_15600 [Streptomyces sp. NPDC006450]|uniref:hypothetical protein n=1 Tax=Streptomyces sp. NPDC006450 TaxID=3155458 RepID=UPI0033AC4C83